MPSWRSPAASSLLPPDVPPALPLNLQPSDSPWRISPRVADVAPGIIGLNLNDIPADRCAVSAMRSEDGRLELFAIGPDDGIYHRATARTVRPTTGPETWTGWTRLGGSAGSGPAVARDPLGRLVVVVMAADGSYKFISQRPSATHAANFTAWTSLGGRFRSRPAVVRDSEGFLHVFGRDVNDTLLHRSQRPHADGPRTKVVWGGWVNVGAPITSRPSAMVDHESMINVYARGQDRQLWRLRQVSVLAEKSLVRWAEWEPLGGVLASTPTLAPSIGSSWLSLVAARSADKALWLLPQQATAARPPAPAAPAAPAAVPRRLTAPHPPARRPTASRASRGGSGPPWAASSPRGPPSSEATTAPSPSPAAASTSTCGSAAAPSPSRSPTRRPSRWWRRRRRRSSARRRRRRQRSRASRSASRAATTRSAAPRRRRQPASARTRRPSSAAPRSAATRARSRCSRPRGARGAGTSG